MTADEKEAELAKALAAACFRQMTLASEAHNYVSTVHAKWGDHPAFSEYITEMGLDHWLSEFLAGGPLRAKGEA